MLTQPFLTNSVQISRMISCFYPPNPVGFCFSHPEVPRSSCCLSWDLWRVPGPDEYVICFECFLWKMIGRSSQEWGIIGDVELGCSLHWSQVEKAGQRCGRGDGDSVTCRDFQEMAIRYVVCAPIASLPPIVTVTIIVAVIIAVTVVTVLQDNSDYTQNQSKIWLSMKRMESMKRLQKPA